MTIIDCLISTLTIDIAYGLEDYLDVPDRCFSVAITTASVLQKLGFDSDVRAVRTHARPVDTTLFSRTWATNSATRPKHVIVRLEDKYIDVTSAQVAPGFPWVMEVKVDGVPRMLNGWEVSYWDRGQYIPTKTMIKKAYSHRLETMVQGMFFAGLRKAGFDVDSDNRMNDEEYWEEHLTRHWIPEKFPCTSSNQSPQ
jgi:hypothetical protein